MYTVYTCQKTCQKICQDKCPNICQDFTQSIHQDDPGCIFVSLCLSQETIQYNACDELLGHRMDGGMIGKWWKMGMHILVRSLGKSRSGFVFFAQPPSTIWIFLGVWFTSLEYTTPYALVNLGSWNMWSTVAWVTSQISQKIPQNQQIPLDISTALLYSSCPCPEQFLLDI